MPTRVELTMSTGVIKVNQYPGGPLLETIHAGPNLTISCAEWELTEAAHLDGDTDFNGVILTYLDAQGEERYRKIDINYVEDGTVYATKEALKAAIEGAVY